MSEKEWLAERFEKERGHLRAVAYRMLGSIEEAEDAVQESWFKLNRSDANNVDNLTGWLTTIVARVCLDMLRSRKSRREEAIESEVKPHRDSGPDPEQEMLMADSVGLALLVVLDRLNPAERLAFVLHDLFGVPFDEIAEIVDRSPEAARQLASRARRRVQGMSTEETATDLKTQRTVVEAFLAALRAGDFSGLLAVLDPNLVFRADEKSAAAKRAIEVRGAEAWAAEAIKFGQGVRFARLLLVDGTVGAVLAPGGRLQRALKFTFADRKIASVEVIGDPKHLEELDLAVLSDC